MEHDLKNNIIIQSLREYVKKRKNNKKTVKCGKSSKQDMGTVNNIEKIRSM